MNLIKQKTKDLKIFYEFKCNYSKQNISNKDNRT